MLNPLQALKLYRRELDRGFGNLRFARELEADFLQDHARSRLPTVRFGLILAGAFYVLFLLIKFSLSAADGSQLLVNNVLRMGVVVSCLSIAFLIGKVGVDARQWLIIGNYGFFSLSLALIQVYCYRYETAYRYEGMIYALFHCALFSGLLFRQCLATLVAMLSLYFGAGWLLGIPFTAIRYEFFFLILAGGMAGASAFTAERLERDGYLRRQIMAASANFDELTGLASRAAFDRYVRSRLRQEASGQNQGQALVLLDLDHFKQLNDSRGHDTGDKSLQLVAEILQAAVDGDPASTGRWGGDELIALLPAPESDELLARLDGIRQQVEELQASNPGSAYGLLTVSIGAALIRPDQRLDESILFRQADEALYEAKQAGRNRVVIRQTEAMAEASNAA